MPGKPTIERFVAPFRPTLSVEATAKLTALAQDAKILEVGGGQSTLFLAQLAKSLTTIENDPAWLAVIKTSLTPEMCPVTFYAVPDDGIAERVERTRRGWYDLVLIDCYQPQRWPSVQAAINKVRVGGTLFVDDLHFHQLAGVPELLQEWESHVIESTKPHPVTGKVVRTTEGFYTRVK